MLSQVKRYIPFPIKYILWYIFKSPQRKLGFFKSIWMEISAVSIWAIHILSGRNKTHLKPVSICTGIKNRTTQYLNYVLPSILGMSLPELIEISIFDCGSDDFPELEKK